MALTLSILLGLVAMIGFLGGANLMLKGTMSFLPEEIAPQVVLDNLFRFLSGIYFSAGFLFAYAAFHVESIGNIVCFLGIMVTFSGLGRLLSRYKVGSAGKYLDFIMVAEILLGLVVIVLELV